jgi:5-methyltetrahydrofolate--homocysteine methyltransferase
MASRPHLLDALRDQVLLCDGGMGARVQAMSLDVDRDYWGKENCTEVLNLSRPDIVREIHRSYYEAGSDMVLTNSFGGSPVTLGEFELEDRAFEINKLSVELAREAAESFADGRHRWVVGDIGPGTKLPSLGNIGYDALEAALTVQCRGLIAGGADAILTETNQDTLYIKAAVNAAKIARSEVGSDIPIFVQVTVETTGTLLVGPDIAAAAAVVHALDVPLIGLNCATGPQEMAEHVRWLSQNWPGLLSVQPNAGLPELVDGKTHYPLGAPRWRPGWSASSRGRLQPDRRLLRHLDAAHRGDGRHAAPLGGRGTPCARAALLPLGAERGEPVFRRLAAAGEQLLLHRRALQRQRLQGVARAAGRPATGTAASPSAASRWARAPTRSTSAPPSSAATRWRDERGHHALHLSVNAPLVIDSTETPVIEAALKLHGGKPIINSINFEEGEGARATA